MKAGVSSTHVRPCPFSLLIHVMTVIGTRLPGKLVEPGSLKSFGRDGRETRWRHPPASVRDLWKGQETVNFETRGMGLGGGGSFLKGGQAGSAVAAGHMAPTYVQEAATKSKTVFSDGP